MMEGRTLGPELGLILGYSLGNNDGTMEGRTLGPELGLILGFSLGTMDGIMEVRTLGPELVSLTVGIIDVRGVGESVTLEIKLTS